MKLLITENKFKEIINLSIKDIGVQTTIKNVGGWKNFCKVLNIEISMDFLHLFDDLEQVQSLEEENWMLFRHKKGHNYMVYDRKNGDVYINYYEIWSFLEAKFGFSYYETQRITQDWLDEVYNLKGVRTYPMESRRNFGVG